MAPTTTSSPATTATTTDAEARLEEVHLILHDLWFGWFDAVYRDDAAAVQEVIATESLMASFDRAAEAQEWPRQPLREDVVIEDVEILLFREDCLVTYGTVDVSSWLGAEAISSGVDVLYLSQGRWKFASHWTNKGDLWETDCDTQRE